MAMTKEMNQAWDKMMKELREEKLAILKKYDGIADLKNLASNYKHFLSIEYADEILDRIATAYYKKGGLLSSELLELMNYHHEKGKIKKEYMNYSIQIMGFEIDYVDTFIANEPEYMKEMEKEFDESFEFLVEDEQQLIKDFSSILLDKVAGDYFTKEEQDEIIMTIDKITQEHTLASYKPDAKFPVSIEEWLFIISYNVFPRDLKNKIYTADKEIVERAIFNLVHDYIQKNRKDEEYLPSYKICNMEYSLEANNTDWISAVTELM